MKNTKKAKGAGKTKSTAVAAVIFGSVLALGGTTVAAPAAYAQQDAAPVAITAVDVDSRGNHFGASYVNKAHQDLMANPEVQRLLEQSDLQAGTAAYNEAAAKLAKSLGKELFGELFRFGLGSVFDVVFDLFGTSEADPLNETLNEIMTSLDSLQQLQQQTLEQTKALHDAIKLQTYKELNAHFVMAAGDINTQTELAALLAEADEVDPDIARGIGEALAGSVGQISYLLVHPESGTIPALIDAFDENVTNGNDYWNNLDTYRDNARAILAQAVVTASAVADNWDPAAIYAQVIADTSVETVANMYKFGVQPDKLRNNGDFGVSRVRDSLQVQGEMALTPRFNPGADMWGVMPYLNEDQETWELEVASTELLEGHLQKMAANYRPSLHDGKTLEQHLRDNDFPTRFAYDDSIRVVNYTTGASKCTWFSTQYRRHYSTVAVDFGTIVGNDYERQTIDYRSTGEANDQTFLEDGKVERCKNLSTSWKHESGSNDEARAAAAENAEYLRHLFQTRDVGGEHTRESLVRRVDNKLGQGVVWVTPNNCPTGYLTDFDADRISEAAFG